jgi:hypothetical protein
MPLLLLLPLLVVAIVLLWALLLPFAMRARYRAGTSRRRAQGWVVGVNAWLLLASVAVFALGAAIAQAWLAHAVRDATLGLMLGVAVGIAGLWLTRFERTADGLYYTPNRWLVLALVWIIAARIVLGMWTAWQRMGDEVATTGTQWLHAGGWLGVGGLLLGYWVAYTWGLRARVRRAA